MTPDTAAAGRECQECEGTGEGELIHRYQGWDLRQPCPDCKGTGRIPAQPTRECPYCCDPIWRMPRHQYDSRECPYNCQGTGLIAAKGD